MDAKSIRRSITSSRSKIRSTGERFGALSITGQEKYRRDFEPLVPGAHFVPRNDITALEQMVNEHTAGIVLELVQGEGGIFPMTIEYVRKARELADRYNALLVFDEIQCGVGRPGHVFRISIIRSRHFAGRHGRSQAAGLRDSIGIYRGE